MPQIRSVLGGVRLNGWDFVASGANGQRWGLPLPAATERREVERALGMVQATDLARRPLAETSGGERQRLLLAQALLGRPRLLLLDEPLISLDPHHQRTLVELTRALQRELGIAVLSAPTRSTRCWARLTVCCISAPPRGIGNCR